MRELLKTNELRQLDVIDYLYQSHDWVRQRDLAKHLNCSERVIKDDLVILKERYEADLEIKSSQLGVRLVFKRNKGLKSVYQSILQRSTAYKILDLTLLNRSVTIEDLVAELYISESTLYRTIRGLSSALFKNYGIKYSTHPFQLKGKEENIRFFYYTYFSERYYGKEWAFTKFDEDALDQLLQLFIQATNIEVDFGLYNDFKLITTVNLFRYKNGHLVNVDDLKENFTEVLKDLTAHQDIFSEIEDKLGFKITLEAIFQLFHNFARLEYSFSYDSLINKTINDSNLNKSVEYLSKLIDNLAKAHHLTTDNHTKEEIILHLSNAAYGEGYEARSRSILYNRNEKSVLYLQNNFPRFFKDLTEGLKEYRKLVNIPTTNYTMNLLIYTICIYWTDLLPSLQKKWHRIKVVIISDMNNGHARLIKDIINYIYVNQIDIEVYDSLKLSEDYLKEKDYDIIIANFPLPEFDFAYSMYVENIPSAKELNQLGQIITEISQKIDKRTYYANM